MSRVCGGSPIKNISARGERTRGLPQVSGPSPSVTGSSQRSDAVSIWYRFVQSTIMHHAMSHMFLFKPWHLDMEWTEPKDATLPRVRFRSFTRLRRAGG